MFNNKEEFINLCKTISDTIDYDKTKMCDTFRDLGICQGIGCSDCSNAQWVIKEMYDKMMRTPFDDLEKDTLIAVRSSEDNPWRLRKFCMKENDKIYCYDNGKSSSDIDSEDFNISYWKFAHILDKKFLEDARIL